MAPSQGLGGLPQPAPGELTVGEAADQLGVSPTWVGKLAVEGKLPARSVHHGKRQHHFFRPEDVDRYKSARPAVRQRASAGAPAPSPPTDEVLYLREQIEKLQAERNGLQQDLIRAKVDWAAGEARLDELRRVCDRQAQTIERLTEAVKEAGQPPSTLGN